MLSIREGVNQKNQTIVENKSHGSFFLNHANATPVFLMGIFFEKIK
jgi:hypothetical protein